MVFPEEERSMNAVMLLTLALTQGGSDAPNVSEVRHDCRTRLESVDGIVSVSYGGADGSYRLLIVCRDSETKAAARKALGGDDFRGLKILWTVSAPASAFAAPPPPAVPPKMAPAPAPDPLKASFTDCDLLAAHLQVKGRKMRATPCQLMRRSVIGGYGDHSFMYAKHRAECPVRRGRVGPPERTDDFITWIFTKGFTPAERTGMTDGYGLRGSNNGWYFQATEDLQSRLPWIRAGAEWIATSPYSTDDGRVNYFTEPPGTGWDWRALGKGTGIRRPETHAGPQTRPLTNEDLSALFWFMSRKAPRLR